MSLETLRHIGQSLQQDWEHQFQALIPDMGSESQALLKDLGRVVQDWSLPTSQLALEAEMIQLEHRYAKDFFAFPPQSLPREEQLEAETRSDKSPRHRNTLFAPATKRTGSTATAAPSKPVMKSGSPTTLPSHLPGNILPETMAISGPENRSVPKSSPDTPVESPQASSSDEILSAPPHLETTRSQTKSSDTPPAEKPSIPKLQNWQALTEWVDGQKPVPDHPSRSQPKTEETLAPERETNDAVSGEVSAETTDSSKDFPKKLQSGNVSHGTVKPSFSPPSHKDSFPPILNWGALTQAIQTTREQNEKPDGNQAGESAGEREGTNTRSPEIPRKNAEKQQSGTIFPEPPETSQAAATPPATNASQTPQSSRTTFPDPTRPPTPETDWEDLIETLETRLQQAYKRFYGP